MKEQSAQCHSPHELAYQDLISRVERINPVAAEILRNPERLEYARPLKRGSLWACFVWRETAQGFKYWADIAAAIDDDIPSMRKEVTMLK